jgi:hypothetical protein
MRNISKRNYQCTKLLCRTVHMLTPKSGRIWDGYHKWNINHLQKLISSHLYTYQKCQIGALLHELRWFNIYGLQIPETKLIAQTSLCVRYTIRQVTNIMKHKSMLLPSCYCTYSSYKARHMKTKWIRIVKNIFRISRAISTSC